MYSLRVFHQLVKSLRVPGERADNVTMDISDITPEIEDLGENLDKLEEVLKPLMEDLGTLSSKAPLLNKAKLNVLTAFAIESLLFCK